MPEPATCSARSAALDEPLHGSASRYRFWLLIEQPGRWGHHATTESELPPDVGARLEELGHAFRMRVLLIKRRDRPWPGRRRCIVSYTGVRERRVRAFDVDDPAELLRLDLPGLVSSRFADVGEPLRSPLYLVCTHGKHDACCARHGAPLYRALADLGDGAVWEATHVGGDRFAGNLVCFPHGLYFGRVRPTDAPAVAGAYARGRIDLRFYRGRSCYSPAVQAAEYFLRRELNTTGVDDLALEGHRVLSPGRHRAEFSTQEGISYRVEVDVFRRQERLVTCKATTPHRPRGFEVRAIEAIGG